MFHYELYMGDMRGKEISAKRTSRNIKNKSKQTNFTIEIKIVFEIQVSLFSDTIGMGIKPSGHQGKLQLC